MIHKFATQAPANSIVAEQLDQNFKRVAPLIESGNAQQYYITQTPDGWTMRIFPLFPASQDLHVLGVRGGTLTWVPTQECP